MSEDSSSRSANLFPRSCGTLLHPTSLPGPLGSGDIGSGYRFIDWLVASGQGLWQTLPLTEVGLGASPYMSPSAFAGNRLLIDLAELASQGWLHPDEVLAVAPSPQRRINYRAVTDFRMAQLARACDRFVANGSASQRLEFDRFCSDQAYWLDDFSLFMAIDETQPGEQWCDWDVDLARREEAALGNARRRLAERIELWKFCQWNFHRQWRALHEYAHQRGVRIFGDAPIFVAYHSADVWAQRHLFELDEAGRQNVVAGVPPDYFSATGQLWGNPLYRWQAHRDQDFRWWLQRIDRNFELADLMRIDHFIGFVNYWEVPACEQTAVNGRWVEGPGRALFDALNEHAGRLAIVAEDLGSVTPAVETLRKAFDLPGMAVIQFAWGGDESNPHLPQHHEVNSVVYSGTHDNDTSVGWWNSIDDSTREFVRRHIDIDDDAPHQGLIRAVLGSRAHTAIIPLQDYLGLDSAHRMNIPGKADGNWDWRALQSDLSEELAAHIKGLCENYQR